MKTYLRSLLILSAILCTTLENSLAQKTIKKYVINNTFPLKTVSPDSTNDDDLAPIANAIGDATVVMLGEQDHGDAPTFQFKTRLIKYLHEKKGFNVLAFESDFFGLNYGWDRLPKTRVQIDTFFTKNIFPIWTYCDACNTLLYNYIPQTYATSTPLTITGFDSQQYLGFSYHNLSRLLDSTLRSHNLSIIQQNNYPAILRKVDSSSKWVYRPLQDTSWLAGYANTLSIIRQQLVEAVSDNDFWVKVTDGLLEEVATYRYQLATGKLPRCYRDAQMAQNLEWLIKNKFKGQKIVVWAHDDHLGRVVGNFKWGNGDKEENMGSRFARDGNAGQNVYLLGFASLQGTAGRLGFKQYTLTAPHSNSFERWMNKDVPYAFIDFKKYNEKNSPADEYFYMTAFDHNNIEAKWNHVFDGVVYIRDMYPCVLKRP